jgi:hypothetical protein
MHFKSCLFSAGKARNASGTDISVIFWEFFFLCSLTFWFREFVFEWDLDQACETRWCLWAVAGQEIWHWATWFEKFMERNCWVYGGCTWELSVLRVVLLLPWFQDWGGGTEYYWNRCSCNFNFPINFIIVLLFGISNILLAMLIMMVMRTEMHVL